MWVGQRVSLLLDFVMCYYFFNLVGRVGSVLRLYILITIFLSALVNFSHSVLV